MKDELFIAKYKPYFIEDFKLDKYTEGALKTLMEINENQPLVSQEESMRRAGVKDPKKMIEDIKKERSSRQENENSNNFN